MEEKDETLQHPSESEEIEEMKAASDDSAAGENNSLAEEDKKDDAPPELSAAKENETISAGAAFSAPAVVQTADPEFSEFQFSDEDLKTLPGAILYKIYPNRFDNRLAERQRTGISPEQWDSHIEQSACALCGVPGGKCDCQITGDIKAHQKITWSY
ncbi:MAG: hypothetical protein BWK80_22260 [Desulfobacteraceae bacterium IS3]|nr:MAG: hypothetical protein BWK80_22260 [Desulfobacteraceae bacterium IS3]